MSHIRICIYQPVSEPGVQGYSNSNAGVWVMLYSYIACLANSANLASLAKLATKATKPNSQERTPGGVWCLC